jgi:hypothetical protein
MTRCTGWAAAALTLTALGLAAGPGPVLHWARVCGVDVWNVRADHAEYRAARERQAELDAEHEALRRQIEASDQVITLLAGGHLTLPVAVDALEDINRDRQGFADGLEYLAPDAPTHRLRLARYAVAKVGLRTEGNADRRAEAAARLEGEYRVMAGGVPPPAESPPPQAVALRTVGE